MEDRDLIEQYAQRGSEGAFTTLVNRYLGLVYSAAMRRVGDAQAAQEIAQTVFCLLARKARQLPPDTPLAGWLHRTVCFTAAKHWRAESRRRDREQQAASMISNEPANDTPWDDLAPHLDEAVGELAETDRLAILLRFFQDKAFPEIGKSLGISEDGARMRVNRALDKLRALLRARNITCSSAGLGTLLAGNVMVAVPATAATAIRTAALEAAKAVGTPSIIAGILALMTRAKLGTALVAGLVVLTAVGIALRVRDKSESRAPGTSAGVGVARDSLANPGNGAAQTRAAFSRVRESRSGSAGSPAAPAGGVTARQLYERGLTHEREKRLDEALADYTQAIELLENGGERWEWFTDLYFTRASLYADRKDYAKAIADYGRVLDHAPRDYSSRFNRALYYTYERQHDKAIADYTTIIESDTDYSKHLGGKEKCLASTYHYRGRAYQDLKDYAKAIEDFTAAAAIEKADNLDEIYWRRALCHKALGQTDQALADASFLAEQALKVAASPASTSDQIDAALHMGRFASEIFAHTVPEHSEAAAAIYARKGNLREAAWYQQKALNALDPSTSAEARAAVQARLDLYNSGK